MINQNLLLTGDDGYNLTNSLRFRSSATAYLSRTGSTATNAKLATYSFWFKRGILTTGQWLFTGGAGGAVTLIGFNGSSDAFSVLLTDVSGEGNITTAVFRDPSAWYHFVIAIDTTQATTADRAKIYVNGVLQTVTLANGGIGINSNWGFNTANTLNIGRYTGGSSYTDGYMTEINFIDGQALTPSSFGETSTSTGVWIPKKFVGTYGTNGFYLPFTDNSALTTSSNVGLGKDFSGNANYWTTNNISITAGSTYDSMTDVPTLTSATAANYAVMNPLVPNGTITNGNLQVASSTTNGRTTIATIPASTAGSWYCEIIPTGKTAGDYHIGVFGTTTTFNPFNPRLLYVGTGSVFNDSSNVATYATYTTNDVMGITYNASTKTASFYKNNTLQGSITTSSSEDMYFGVCGDSSGTSQNYAFNFGQRPFTYTPPTGFVALNTFNLPTSTIVKGNTVMNVLTWSGTGGSAGATRSLTGLGFKPDFVWEKDRLSSQDHHLFDSVRGAGLSKTLASNSTNAEGSFNDTLYGYLSSFDSDGMTTTNGSSTWDNWNKSGDTYVGWAWRASNATAVTNTAGSISAQVSANTTSGFSIVTYTGNATNGATVGHGLGVEPSIIIIKVRNATARWVVYQKDVTTANNQFLELNSFAGVDTSGTNFWTISSINNTTFGLGTNGDTNGSTLTFVAYCFAPVAGYSAFGSYTGNGSTDGTFVYTGFRPRFVLLKSSSAATDWYIYDTARDTYNVATLELNPNLAAAEQNGTYGSMDILSNGFKLRFATGEVNASGATYIYYAVAENPFKYANAR